MSQKPQSIISFLPTRHHMPYVCFASPLEILLCLLTARDIFTRQR